MLDLDKRVGISGEPPQLPPYLRKRRGGGGRRTIILPDLELITYQTVIPDPTNNWKTIIHHWMNRWSRDLDNPNDALWEVANIHTRIYRRWLETYTTTDGVPPHICFGGAIESGRGDPTFYSRWRECVMSTFV